MADEMKIGDEYNWINQPERLKYIGKEGAWHQFELIGKQGVWCEVLDRDLHMLERSNNAVQLTTQEVKALYQAKNPKWVIDVVPSCETEKVSEYRRLLEMDWHVDRFVEETYQGFTVFLAWIELSEAF